MTQVVYRKHILTLASDQLLKVIMLNMNSEESDYDSDNDEEIQVEIRKKKECAWSSNKTS